MNYKCTFFYNVYGIDLNIKSLSLVKEFKLIIGTEEKVINDFFDDNTTKITGLNQFEQSLKLKSFIYNKFEIKKTDLNEEQLLTYIQNVCCKFSHSLWLIKDSSVRFNLGHLKYIDNLTLTIHSNFINSIYTNCLAVKNTTSFSNQEIRKSLTYFNFLFNLTLKSEIEQPAITHAEANRIVRSFYFIDLARQNFEIGTKISLLCSAFECLFSTNNAELTHRLSETIANFLEKDLNTKKETYQKIKHIYSVRSSVTHGTGLEKKLMTNDSEKLKEIGKNCDEIMRRCIIKIIKNKKITDMYIKNNKTEIENFFMDLNFK